MKDQKDNILQTIKVDTKSELLTFLIDKNVRKSRNAIKSLLAHKLIKINNKTVSQYNQELQEGDIITIHKTDHKRDPKKLKGITIVYEDEFILVVEKEYGLLSIATDREKRETAYSVINEYLKKKDRNARAYILYRLDRESSGLMLYAKTPEVQETLQRNWNNLILSRLFAVVVEEQVEEPEGTILSWLTEDKNFVMHSSPRDNGGQRSVTHYKRLKGNNKFTMLSVDLETSRKNQIRVHMKHIGHSIVGDKKYGSKINPIKRIALHASELSFIHPMTNETLEFKSPVPKKIQSLFE